MHLVQHDDHEANQGADQAVDQGVDQVAAPARARSSRRRPIAADDVEDVDNPGRGLQDAAEEDGGGGDGAAARSCILQCP